MKLKTIKFSEQWDKLDERHFYKGAVFTTVRGYTPRKEMWYTKSLGVTFLVKCGNRILGRAKLDECDFRWADTLSLSFIRTDTKKEMTRQGFYDLMYAYYGNPKPFLFLLYFKVTSVGGEENGQTTLEF